MHIEIEVIEISRNSLKVSCTKINIFLKFGNYIDGSWQTIDIMFPEVNQVSDKEFHDIFVKQACGSDLST